MKKILLPDLKILTSSLCGLVLFWLSMPASAQSTLNNCDPVYEKALAAYREGRINEVAGILKECLEDWNGEREADAHKLLTNTYLYFNERAQAENAMLRFLRINPEYVIDADSTSENRDSPEFINLYNSFRTRPIFLIGAKAGGNWSLVHGTKGYSLENIDEFANQKYKGQLAYQVGITAEIPIWKKISLNPELYLAGRSYEYTTTLMDFASIAFTEKQTWLELPILVKYNFALKNKSRVPFINAGASIQYLAGSNAAIIRRDTESQGNIRSLEDDKVEQIYDLRHKVNYNAIIGAGLKLKNVVGKGYITVEGRYTHGLRNIVNPRKRAASLHNSELVYNFLHIDNDFTLNSFSLSVGYIMPQYKPKVLRKRQ